MSFKYLMETVKDLSLGQNKRFAFCTCKPSKIICKQKREIKISYQDVYM